MYWFVVQALFFWTYLFGDSQLAMYFDQIYLFIHPNSQAFHSTSREIWASSQTLPRPRRWRRWPVGGWETQPICVKNSAKSTWIMLFNPGENKKSLPNHDLVTVFLSGHEIQLPSKHVARSPHWGLSLAPLVQWHKFQNWLPRIPPTQTTTWSVNLTPFNHQLHHFFSHPKNNWDPSFTLNKTHLTWPTENSTPPSHEDCRKFHRCPWAPHHLPPPQKRLSWQLEAAQGFTKRAVFKHGDVNLYLFKRLIHVEMVSDFLVVHLSQMQLICCMIPSFLIVLRKESSQPTTLQ